MEKFSLSDADLALHEKRKALIEKELEKLDPSSEEHFTLKHRIGLGGSDMGILMGLNRYQTRRQMWLTKTGRETNHRKTLAMEFGHWNEPFVAKLYEEKTGYTVKNAETYQAPNYPYLIANFDRLVVEQDANGIKVIGGLECKTCGNNSKVYDPFTKTTRYKWGDGNVYDERGVCLSKSTEIDPAYYAQVQFYLMVSGLPWWDVAVLISNRDFRVFTIEPDTVYQAYMLQIAYDFWVDNVLHDKEPELVVSDIEEEQNADDIRKDADADAIKLYQDICKVQSEMDALKAQKDALCDKFAAYFEDATVLMMATDKGPKKIASFKSIISHRFNTTAFKEADPETYQKFCQASVGKRSLHIY